MDNLGGLTIYFIDGQDARVAFAGVQECWGRSDRPPTISLVTVSGLTHPQFLLEVHGVAVLPAG